jgi:hypothetical protein
MRRDPKAVAGPSSLHRALARLAIVALWITLTGCGRNESPQSPGTNSNPPPARGQPIRPIAIASNAATNPFTHSLSAAEMAALLARTDAKEKGFLRPGFDKLSAFKYDVHEVYSETNSGRAPLRSDDVIPPQIKAYDGQRVAITGYVLPLRTRRGVVTEFLLLRDQGTCCFGARAQINHFIRVSFPTGIQPGEPVPWKVRGTLRVGETYVQGYLTGLFHLEAETAVEAPK